MVRRSVGKTKRDASWDQRPEARDQTGGEFKSECQKARSPTYSALELESVWTSPWSLSPQIATISHRYTVGFGGIMSGHYFYGHGFLVGCHIRVCLVRFQL